MIVSDSTVLKANFPLLSRKPRKPVPRSWPMVRSVAADGQRRLAAPSPRSPPFPDVAEDARRRHKAASGGVPRIWRTTTPRRCLLFYSKQSKKKIRKVQVHPIQRQRRKQQPLTTQQANFFWFKQDAFVAS